MLDYFRLKTRRHSAQAVKSPILNEDDEAYFAKLAGEETPPALPARPVRKGKDPQVALMDGADQVPLPTSPPVEPHAQDEETVQKQTEVAVEEAAAENGVREKDNVTKTEAQEKAEKRRSWRPKLLNLQLGRRKSQHVQDPDTPKKEDKHKKLEKHEKHEKHEKKDKHKAEESTEDSVKTPSTEEKDNEDLTAVLDQLNLSAVNNRVFSFSKESQRLLEQFTLVLKDIVHGAPHAYDDLEKLLSRNEQQLNKMYNALPPFIQSLIKSLPAKIGATLAPELLAASSEKPGADMTASATSAAGASTSAASEAASGMKSKIPSLKSLVGAQGAVATMLRSILNFLKLRFPTLMTGTNVLLSLAVFILLFVFWYCHKRGRQERLALDEKATDEDSSTVGAAGDDSSTRVEPADSEATDVETPRATVDDLPSVLHLPDPATVPLPTSPDEKQEKELEAPVQQKT